MTVAKAKETENVAAAKVVPETPLNIYQIISKISQEAGALEPTQKPGVPFPFRGVDGVVNHLSPFLRQYGVIVIPEVVDVTTTARDSGTKTVKTTELTTKFTFYAPDGSSVAAVTAGLADDYADRSAAQAQSVAFRIALLQVFALPTQSPEPEQTGQVVQDGRSAQPAAPAPKVDDSVAAKLRAEISAIIGDNNNPYTGDMVNELGDKITGKARNDWFSSAADLKKVVANLQSGVTV